MKVFSRVGLFFCLLGILAGAGSALAQTSDTATPTKQVSAAKPKPASKSATHKKGSGVPAPLPSAKLDLRLPAEMVKDLKPATQDPVTTPKPLLPYLFGEKPPSDSPFQLNGRLLSNEMQLQLRNDARHDVEGAAIEFEFKQ